jgi:uncharacterized protein (DUF2141 family)
MLDSMKDRFRTLIAGAILLAASPWACPQNAVQTGVIRVEVSGLRSDKGEIMCALFASADGFPKKGEKALAHAKGAITQKQALCEFSGVAPGTYAVSVFHDENSNGKLDTNFIGMPKEGVGASNNASGHMGPPKFEAAAFQYTGGTMQLKISIRYL